MIIELLQNTYIQTILKGLILVFMFIVPLAAFLTLLERRWSAFVQDRIGPSRANVGKFRLFGIFHILADGIKLAFKEDFMPRNTDRVLFTIAPIFSFFSALTMLALVPITSNLGSFKFQLAEVNIGILAILAFMSFGVYGAVLAGWSTDNKYGMLGAVRATAQMISYEIFLGLSIIGLLVVYSTFSINQIVAAQNQYWFSGLIPKWGILVQPVGFLLFFTALLSEMKRTPFDAPEGESEIVAGYFIEYSGMRFGAFFVAEYITIVASSILLTTLFLGSYHIPWLFDDGFNFLGLLVIKMPDWLVVMLRFGSFVAKTFFFCWLIQMLRWTVPRFRFDQIMKLGWNRMLPLSLINLIVTIIITLWF